MTARAGSARGLLVGVTGLLAALALAGCAPSNDMSQLQNNEFALRGMVANDRQQIESLQERVSQLNDKLSELEHNGGGGGSNQIASLNNRVSKLESQVASIQPSNGNPGAMNGAGVPGTPPPGSDLAAGTPPGAPVPPGAGGPASRAEAPPPAAPAFSWRDAADQELNASPNDPGARLYRAGLLDMKAGKYDHALAKFEDLQHRYPKSDLSEPAEFFAANALYETGKYDQSILQFNDLTMRFPKGRFASSSLLREAQAFMKINDRIDARLTLQKLLNEHPDSPEASTAKSMMQTLAS